MNLTKGGEMNNVSTKLMALCMCMVFGFSILQSANNTIESNDLNVVHPSAEFTSNENMDITVSDRIVPGDRNLTALVIPDGCSESGLANVLSAAVGPILSVQKVLLMKVD